MLVSAIIGGTGVGLVWGWLAASFLDRLPNFIATLAVLLSTLVLAAALWGLNAWSSGLVFLGVALFSFLLHLVWRKALRRQIQTYNPE